MGAKLQDECSGIVLTEDTNFGEISLGGLLWKAMLPILDPFQGFAVPNAALEPRRKGDLNVEFEEIVGAMGILRDLHNVATGEVTPDSRIGETQLDGLVIVPHGNIDTAKAFERAILNGCEMHARHLVDSDKLRKERQVRKERRHGRKIRTID
jgi:hypothetical protein